jgi:hypothetical protein
VAVEDIPEAGKVEDKIPTKPETDPSRPTTLPL